MYAYDGNPPAHFTVADQIHMRLEKFHEIGEKPGSAEFIYWSSVL